MQIDNIPKYLFVLAVAASVGFAGCSKSDKKETPAQQAEQAAPQTNLSAVIAELEARHKQNPKDHEALWHLGDAHFEMRQFKEASDYYKKALQLKPDEVDIYNELGLAMHYTGNTAEALRYVDEGIKRNPLHQRIWLTKGYLLAYGMGDLEGAKKAWEKAKILNPESQVGKAASEYLTKLAAKN